MDEHNPVLQPIAAWLHLGGFGYTILRASALAALCFVVIAAFEHRSGASLSRYASRHFAVDLLYRLVIILYMAALWNPLVAALRTAYPSLNLGLLNRAPMWVAVPVSWLVFDFIGYWTHRMQHSRWLWRFHRVHHSQEQMTFATGFRGHPFDQWFALSIGLVPVLLLGSPAATWVPYTLALALLEPRTTPPCPGASGRCARSSSLRCST
jgi:sterol desaturase/sphingolipid hydroxylase (fatty acid hydroxylase superfamily)